MGQFKVSKSHIAYFGLNNNIKVTAEYAKGLGQLGGRQDLYISNRDGSEPRRVATLPGFLQWPSWSADGRVLRFTRNVSLNLAFLRGDLWEVRPDGTHLHPLLTGRSNQEECCGAWTADGKYYVFRAGQNRGDLWARCEKGTLLRRCPPEPVQLTAGPLSFLDVAPSRDGKKLFAIGSDRRVELVKYDLKSRRFEPYLSGISAEGVSFSKDGQWVAYASIPDGTLWRSKLDGSDRLRITLPGMSAHNPKWSPDGKQIAFQAQSPGQKSKGLHHVGGWWAPQSVGKRSKPGL